RDDLSPPPKRIKDFDSVTDLEISSEDGYEPYVPREVGLGMDFEDSYEPYTEPDIDSEIQEDIDECIAERERRLRVEVDPKVGPVIKDDACNSVREDFLNHLTVNGVVEVTYKTLGGLVQRFHDHVVEILVHWIQVIESEQRLQGHMITGGDLEVTTMIEGINTLERDNTSLRGISMPTATCTGITQDTINKLIPKHIDEALMEYEDTRNPKTKAEMENEQQENHVEENVNNENSNGNGNGNPNVNDGGVVPVARECTYQDFVKCQPLNFKGMEVVVGLTRWFEKVETVFHISNCPPRYQVKYATCTLLDGALTWYNSHKRKIRVDDAYAMTWKALMKLMTEVEKYIRALPDNIQGNVIDAKPTRLQDTIRVANNLMDQKLKGYAIKNVENKRRFESSSRDNHGQR
nr:hypothetical protein [Tanacetum cinerariifolium]